jgi:hypothetical protein
MEWIGHIRVLNSQEYMRREEEDDEEERKQNSI